MTHSWRFKSAVAVGACAAVGAIGGIAAGAAAPSHGGTKGKNGPETQSGCPAPVRIGMGGPPMAMFAFGGPPVHAVQIVPNKAGDGFDTLTEDSGTVKSVSGDKLTITEGTEKATYATPTLTIPANATIQRNGESAKLSEIQTGDHVDVSSGSDGTTSVFAVDSGQWPPKPTIKQGRPPGPGFPIYRKGGPPPPGLRMYKRGGPPPPGFAIYKKGGPPPLGLRIFKKGETRLPLGGPGGPAAAGGVTLSCSYRAPGP